LSELEFNEIEILTENPDMLIEFLKNSEEESEYSKEDDDVENTESNNNDNGNNNDNERTTVGNNSEKEKINLNFESPVNTKIMQKMQKIEGKITHYKLN